MERRERRFYCSLHLGSWLDSYGVTCIRHPSASPVQRRLGPRAELVHFVLPTVPKTPKLIDRIFPSRPLPAVRLQYVKNRLSKFQYYTGDPDATRDSEEVLLESAERTRFLHNGGWVGFKPSDYSTTVSLRLQDQFWSGSAT